MTCSKEEFLFVLKKWMSSSHMVVLTLVLGPRTELSAITVTRLTGYIKNVDHDGLFFVLACEPDGINEGNFATIGLDDWDFSFADKLENPAMAGGLVCPVVPINEAIYLSKPNFAQISLFAVGLL